MKKFLKAFLIAILLIASVLLLSVGPLFNLRIKDNKIILTSEITEEVIEELPEEEIEQPTETPEVETIDEGILLGDEVLKFLNIELENKFYLQTISSWVSGLLFSTAISLMVKGKKKRVKKVKKSKKSEVPEPVTVYSNGLRIKLPTTSSQNNNKNN